ncbi:MAG TPA: glycosyltransferase family 4 protein [Acidimicrobiales bacterium]|nr:glycosyltransferase family 4 protein [Acidimicrobiales bacterium]
MDALIRRRIVVIDQYFPPDTSATARIISDFAEVCVEQRAPLTIVCGFPSYDPGPRLSWRPLRRVRSAGMTRYVIGSTGFDRRSALGRVCNYVSFMVGAALLIPLVCRKAAVVVLTDPPMAPLLGWWARRAGHPASVALWIQDLHPDFGVAAGLLSDNVVVRAWRSGLRAALRAADDVIVLGRDMARRVEQVGVAAPTRVVHNGWSGVARQPQRDVGDGARRVRVMHFGNIGFAGPWPSVLAAARALVDVAEFEFIGGGAGEAEFADAPSNVAVFSRVAHSEVSRLAAQADLLLVGVRAGLEGYVVPSKGYEMMALGRPLLVVSVPDSEMRLLVEERGCGLTVDDRPEALVEAIRSVAAGHVDLAAMANNAATAAGEFERKAQFALLVEALSSA